MTAAQEGKQVSFQQSSLVDRLNSATEYDALAQSTSSTSPPRESVLSGEARTAITSENLDKLISQLNLSTDRLQGAMHRIGFLESQIESMESQLAFMPDFRAKAARCIVLEKENQELKAVIEHRNKQLVKREQLLDERNQQIAILEKIIAAYKKHLNMVEKDLHKLEGSAWMRFCAWFSGSKLPNQK